MITKEYINKLKTEKNGKFSELLNPQEDNKHLLFILDNLGRLPQDFNGECFIPLLNHQNDKVRLLTVKNIGKLKNDYYLDYVSRVAYNDDNTMVRREALSAIGRMRSEKAIPLLIKKLKDSDPKVILQSIRALLVFKNNNSVRNRLKKLIKHPNEMIQYVINKEFINSNNGTKKKKQKHPESPAYMKNVIVRGDVRDALKHVPDESIHLTFTSPPYYNARDYSIYQSYKEYLEFLRSVFKAVHRVTKEGRFFILDTSPIIIPRVSRQHSSKRYPIPYDIHPFLVKMGWEFIDDIIWVKPEASVKNRNAGFLQHRKPLGYKSNARVENIMVYRKKTDKLIDWNIKQYDLQTTIKRSKVNEEYETSNVWRIDPVFDKKHSAVFPLELCNRIIKFYSYIGDLVFDPFAGSGTFGRAAINLNRYFFLTETEAKYIKRIKENIRQYNLSSTHIKPPQFLNLKTFILNSKV